MSPDAHYFEAQEDCGPLDSGVDPDNVDSASLLLILNVSLSPGQFIIDTCCVSGLHLRFRPVGGGTTVPSFTPGVITVTACGCPCQADPQCDGVTDLMDVVEVIDRAFRGGPRLVDANCLEFSPNDGFTDVDCSNSTDIIDVVKVVSVALQGADPQVIFCVPCP